MKNRLILLFIAIILIGLSPFILKIHYKVHNLETINEAEGVTMKIEKETLTRTGANIIITDISGNDNTYGNGCKIEIRANGNWRELETINGEPITSTMEGHMVNSEHKLYMHLNWGINYGELENGEYRVVKSCLSSKNQRYYLYTEFIINDEIK